ncbi:MAG: hypothetical protein ACRDP7_11515 [Trebonia sp.]
MLLGSVPRPPRKPRSWTRTQSARHGTAAAISASRISRRRPASSAAPVAASTITTNRFTAKPCAMSNAPNAETMADSACGCEVCATPAIMPARVPGWPWMVPCQ